MPPRLAARAELPLCRGAAGWTGTSVGALLAVSSGSRSRVARRCVVVLRRARVKFGKGKAGAKPKARTRQSRAKSSRDFPKLPPEDVFSLDVECVAVGKTHRKSDREPCSLALVDGLGTTLMRTLIQPVRPVVSYLTPYTGLRRGDLDGGKAISLARAIQDLKRLLPKRAVLVGQSPLGDVEWMHLKEGVDYTSIVDLADVFANDRDMKFSLRHEALVLLGKDAAKGVHDPCWDAAVSVELYRKAADATPKELDAMRELLTDKKYWPPKPSLARECGYQIDGVCLSCYVAEHCICGAPIEGDKRR